MKTKQTLRTLARMALLLATIIYQPSASFAQGTSFTYQGVLNEIAGPANGSFDLTFQVFDAPTGGTSQGGPLTNAAVAIVNGLFTVTMDFGASPFSAGAPLWLEIATRTNGVGSFSTLNPRQALTATPYAITAGNLTGTVTAGQIAGTLGAAQIPNLDASKITTGTLADARIDSALARDAEVAAAYQPLDADLTDLADGSLTGSKVGTGINAANITTGTLGDGRLTGNVALRAGGNSFTGDQTVTGGNMGIGTASPGTSLRIQGAGTLGDIWLSPTTAGGNADIFLSENVSGSFGIKLRHNGVSNDLEVVGVNSSVETSPLVTIGRGSSSGVSIANNLTVGGSATVGSGGSPMTKILSTTATLDFPSTLSQTSSDLTITLTGATLGDTVLLGVPNVSVLPASAYSAWVSAANTVTVRLLNANVGTINPASGTFRVGVLQF